MKNWRKTAIVCGLIFVSCRLTAQESKLINRIGIEFGVNEFIGKTVVPDRVRAGDIIKSGSSFNNTIDVPYIGIKYEQCFFDKRMGFAAGLRFTQFSSAIHGKTAYFLIIPYNNCFLWQFNENGIYTDYLKIIRITQDNNYLGIPLEFTYVLENKDTFFRPYIKVGAVVNKLVSTKSTIEFLDDQMNQYADAVGNQVEKPNAFNAYFYPALGFKLGKNRYICGNVEIQYTPIFIPKRIHPFISSDYGIGIHFSLQIPLRKKEK